MRTNQEISHQVDNSSKQFASLVKRIGSPVSTILLDSSCKVFSLPEIEGMVGYHQYKNCAVAIGDPVCLEENREKLANAFQDYCQYNQWSLIYFFASEPFAHWAINHGCKILIQAGEELILNPLTYKKTQKIRWKVNHSINHGVKINEYLKEDLILEEKLNTVMSEWLKTKKGPQIHLGNFDHLNQNNGRRIFYAIQENKIVGLLILLPVEKFKGWVVSSFISLDSTVGSGEHLMSSVIEVLASENCQFLCIGGASGSKLGEIVGLNPFSKCIAKFFYSISKWLFRLDAKSTYLHKYHPQLLPTYILTTQKLGLNELLAMKKILNVKLTP